MLLLETRDDFSRFAFESIHPVIERPDCQPQFRDLMPEFGEVTFPANLVDE
jgi:hypothetical protein